MNQLFGLQHRRSENFFRGKSHRIATLRPLVTMFAVANGYVRLLNSLSGAASPLPLGNPSVCFS